MLAELGDPWSPDPTVSDDEPLPEFPTGGDGEYEPADRAVAAEALIAVAASGSISSSSSRRSTCVTSITGATVQAGTRASSLVPS